MMKWLKTPHSDDDGWYWRSEHGGLSADVELAPWLNAEKPWTAWVSLCGFDTMLPQSKTASEAKAKVRKRLQAAAKRLTAWVAA